MADNVTIPATGTGTATPVVATDDVGGVHYQRVKLDVGGDGAASPVTSIAKETGGNLDTIVTSLGVMDDWDETDRAKVNLIVGQAGIAGGTGTDGATVPRVTLATNVPLPAGTNAIGKLAANSGVDIGDVDVLTLPTQTGQTVYTASGTFTISPQNVATSATFVAGVESDVVSNISTKYDDVLIAGKWTCGTTPTVNTTVNIYVYAPLSDDLSSTLVYPDVLDGTASAETFTSAGILASSVKLAAVLQVDSTTSDRTYPCAPFSVKALFGGNLPTRFGLFIAHNTGVNSNSTAGNHAWYYTPIQRKVV